MSDQALIFSKEIVNQFRKWEKATPFARSLGITDNIEDELIGKGREEVKAVFKRLFTSMVECMKTEQDRKAWLEFERFTQLIVNHSDHSIKKAYNDIRVNQDMKARREALINLMSSPGILSFCENFHIPQSVKKALEIASANFADVFNQQRDARISQLNVTLSSASILSSLFDLFYDSVIACLDPKSVQRVKPDPNAPPPRLKL